MSGMRRGDIVVRMEDELPGGERPSGLCVHVCAGTVGAGEREVASVDAVAGGDLAKNSGQGKRRRRVRRRRRVKRIEGAEDMERYGLRDLSTGAMLLYAVVLLCGGETKASDLQLGTLLDRTPSTVNRNLRELRSHGYVSVERKGGRRISVLDEQR